MGRWSQRRLRGGSPGSAPPAPAGVLISSVVASGSPGVVTVTFAAPVSFTPGFYGDSGFSINGGSVSSVNTIPGSPGTDVNMSVGGSWSSGSTWDVTGQPAWLTDAILVPQSGLVS